MVCAERRDLKYAVAESRLALFLEAQPIALTAKEDAREAALVATERASADVEAMLGSPHSLSLFLYRSSILSLFLFLFSLLIFVLCSDADAGAEFEGPMLLSLLSRMSEENECTRRT